MIHESVDHFPFCVDTFINAPLRQAVSQKIFLYKYIFPSMKFFTLLLSFREQENKNVIREFILIISVSKHFCLVMRFHKYFGVGFQAPKKNLQKVANHLKLNRIKPNKKINK